LIWYFLAGVIAGIVGTVKYSRWWVWKHITIVETKQKDMEEKTDE